MSKEITKILVQDMSCDPIKLTDQTLFQSSDKFIQACERASIWNARATDIGIGSVLGVAIQNSISRLLNEFEPWDDGFHFDLKMIEAVGELLESEQPDVKLQYAHFVTNISEQYANIMSLLKDIGDSKVADKAKEIFTQIHVVSEEVEKWAHKFENSIGEVEKLPLPQNVKNILENLRTISSDVTSVATNVENIIDYFWQKAEGAVKFADDLNDKAKILRDALENASSEEKLKLEMQIQAIETQLTRQKDNLEASLNSIKSGFQATGIIIGLFGKSELANDIVSVGEAAVTIVGSVATLIAGSAVGGPAMPVVAIVGAVAMLANRFFGGGSPQREDVILKAINQLSAHIDKRFERIEVMIQKSVEILAEHIDRRIVDLGIHIDKRFDRIEEALNYMYKDMLQKFAEIYKDQAKHFETIQYKLDSIKQAIDYLHADFSIKILEVYTQSYRDIKSKALQPYSRDLISEKRHIDYYRKITDWVKNDVVNSVNMAGDDKHEKLVEMIRANGINININKLRSKATSLGISDPGRLANPAAWADGVRTLITYFGLTPELYQYVRPNNVILTDIAKIKNNGLKVRNFIRSVQTDHNLFQKLISQYESALIMVMRQAYYICIKPDEEHKIGTASAGVKEALKRVTAIEISEDFIKNEIYPADINVLADLKSPNEKIPPTDVDESALSFPASKILKPIAAKFLSDIREFHNDRVRDVDQAAGRGEVGPDFTWALYEQQNPDAVIHTWNGLLNHYNKKSSEASSLREFATSLFNFVEKSHLEDLTTQQPDYRNGRISAVLSHHALVEIERAQAVEEMPDITLMNKYFSIQNMKALNVTLNNEAKNTFGILLDRLQDAFDELTIFIAFAFPRQFANDPQMRVFLDRLCDKQDILDFIAPNNSSNKNFVGINLQNILESHGEFDNFKRFIVGLVADAKLSIECKTDTHQYDNFLIEKVLEELNDFEESALLATKGKSPINIAEMMQVNLTNDIEDNIKKPDTTALVNSFLRSGVFLDSSNNNIAAFEEHNTSNVKSTEEQSVNSSKSHTSDRCVIS